MELTEKLKTKDPQPVSLLTSYLAEINRHSVFMYYPEYNPLRTLGKFTPPANFVAEELYSVKPREAN